MSTVLESGYFSLTGIPHRIFDLGMLFEARCSFHVKLANEVKKIGCWWVSADSCDDLFVLVLDDGPGLLPYSDYFDDAFTVIRTTGLIVHKAYIEPLDSQKGRSADALRLRLNALYSVLTDLEERWHGLYKIMCVKPVSTS